MNYRPTPHFLAALAAAAAFALFTSLAMTAPAPLAVSGVVLREDS